MTDKLVVLVTCGNPTDAERIARGLVERHLAACVNILESRVRSVYRWKRRVETAAEQLLLIKTSRRRFAAVEQAVRELHSYAVPEILAVPVAAGSRAYLAWLAECVDEPGRKKRRRGKRRAKGRRKKSR